MGSDVPRISKEEVSGRIGDPDMVVLDVRKDADWNSSDRKIQGAVREQAADVANWAPRYSRDKTIVLY